MGRTRPPEASGPVSPVQHVLALQRLVGNAAVAGLLTGRSSVKIQRQAARDEVGADLADHPERRGHPWWGKDIMARLSGGPPSPAAAPPAPPVASAPMGAPTGPAAAPAAAPGTAKNPHISTKLIVMKPPNITHPTQAAIATKHNSPKSVGWTAAKADPKVVNYQIHGIDVETTVSFDMELSSGLTPGEERVVHEHELGHMRIGETLAPTFFDQGLQADLRKMPHFGSPNDNEAVLGSAKRAFYQKEYERGKAFDAVEYPRMTEAYVGERTALVDLQDASPKVRALVDALAYLVQVAGESGSLTPADAGSRPADVLDAVVAVTTKEQALTKKNRDQLQYNGEFARLVAKAKAAAATLRAEPNTDAQLPQRIASLLGVLDGYTYSAEGVLKRLPQNPTGPKAPPKPKRRGH